MALTDIALSKLVAALLLPALLVLFFYLAERKTGFGRLPDLWKQLAFGLGFGAAAIFATHFGVQVDGAVLSIRNAAPLTAGLVFGWPAALISGAIGGIHRWYAEAGEFTRLAGTLGTVIAGIGGAAVRKFMLDNKRASWFYGLVVGMTIEVVHLLMAFMTNTDDIARAFGVVKDCAMPMIMLNGLAIMIAMIVISAVSKRGIKREEITENIANTFQRWLLLCVVLAFVVTMIFTQSIQTRLAYATVEQTLKTNIEDVRNDIRDASNRNLLSMVEVVANDISGEFRVDWSLLARLARRYLVQEINVIDENGIVTVSTNPEIVGYDMASKDVTAEFLVLLDGETEYVQDMRANVHDSDGSWKFAGVALPDGGFVQIGCTAKRFQRDIDEQVVFAAKNRHVGQTGNIIICNDRGIIVSDREGREGQNVYKIGGMMEGLEKETIFEAVIYDAPCLCMYTESEGYYIIAVLPEEEAMFAQAASVYMLAFMELLVFAALFTNIFVLIKRLVVENIRKINDSLAMITDGDLSVQVDVRDNEEFASLSDDINSTVATLRHYIDEAAARFDKDLEIAKTIQHSSLPSVFPPYPSRKDFAIFASMDAAKEVGGDFYDFYLLDENHLAFVVADVSGKGIPGAMFMMTSKTLIKSHAESGLSVDEVFTHVNAQLCEHNDAGMFVTAWMGILDLESGIITYANAGHNPPVIKHKDGTREYLKGKVNLVLAGMEGVRYAQQEVQLQRGDEIYLYTDGVTEAHNSQSELFGEDRLLESLNTTDGMTVEALCEKVKTDVDAFVGDAEQFDDITMMCVRLNEREDRWMNTIPVKESIPRVAAFVEDQLECMDIPVRTSRKLMVALDEIYSNIVLYSGATETRVGLVKEEDILRMTFRDNGRPYNPLDTKAPNITAGVEDREIGGLGVFMVRKMMDNVDYMYKDGRNVLTLTVHL